MKNKTFSFLLAVLMSMVASVAWAHDFVVGGIYYEITSSAYPYTASVTYRGSSYTSYSNEYTGSVTIPESVTYSGKTYSVTSIGYQAFMDCTGLTSVTIPNSVTRIGGSAFDGCSGLTSIEIPNSVTSIGDYAFYGTAWYNNQPDGMVYAGKVAYKYKGAMPKGTEIVLEEGTLGIADYAFYGRSGLTSVVIPNNVKSIGGGAFWGCSDLTSVSIGNSVTSIDNYAFADCTGLTSIEIPNSVTSIGDYAFRGCSGLTSVVIPNSVTSIGDYAFSDCSGLTSVTIPNSVTSIGDYAFRHCSGLTSITINSNKLASNSFFSNYFPEDVPEYIIGNDVISIGANAFKGCTGLIKLTLGSRLQSIGSKAFADSGIRQLLIKSNTPPTAPLDVFSEQTLLRTTLYVPVGTVDDYAYANGWYKFNTIKESALTDWSASNEYAYTLMNAKTFDYAVYDAVNDRVKMVGISNVDETNPKHCWQTVEMYGRKYLYNVGAKKFAVPGTGEAGLSMSSDVSSISMQTGTDGIVLGDNTEQQWALVVDTKMDAYLGLEDVIVTGVLPIDNGQLTMDNAKGVYDLSGRRMNVNDNDNVNSKFEIQNSKLRKGIYIVNGKKVLIE